MQEGQNDSTFFKTLLWSLKNHIYGLVQESRNSSALAMELRLSCTNPLISKKSFTQWVE